MRMLVRGHAALHTDGRTGVDVIILPLKLAHKVHDLFTLSFIQFAHGMRMALRNNHQMIGDFTKLPQIVGVHGIQDNSMRGFFDYSPRKRIYAFIFEVTKRTLV